MVIDTSALIAIVREEPEGPRFARYLARAERPRVSAASLLEAHLVLSRNPAHVQLLTNLIAKARIEIAAVSEDIVLLARNACGIYGRGTRAGLNFGGLFSYATAKTLNLPLLFKGDDFVHTDVYRVDQ